MEELLRTLGVWLIGVSGTTAVIGGIAAWVGKLVADKLSAATNARYARELEQLKTQYSTDLENLRAELASRRDVLSSAHGALASGYAGAYERVVTAIDFLWNNIMETRKFVDPYIFFYQILLPSEYENASQASVARIREMIPSRSEIDFHEEATRLREGIAEKRPFLGERLWWLQYSYFAFAMRQAHKLRQEREQGQFFAWNKNPDGTPDTMVNILDYVLTKSEQDALIGTGTETGTVADLGIPQRILAAIESKILTEMNEWIFGRRLVTMSIEEQRRLIPLLFGQDEYLGQGSQNRTNLDRPQGHEKP